MIVVKSDSKGVDRKFIKNLYRNLKCIGIELFNKGK